MRNKQIKINQRVIGINQPVFVIAEAGVNHNGSLELAKKMVCAAKAAGADAIKFQTFKTEELVTPYAAKADYQRKRGCGQSQFEMLKKLELSELDFEDLFSYCKKKKILFISTPFDSQSAKFLIKLGVAAFKVGSGELTNIPLLLQVAKYGRPIILSTGMATLKEVREAVEAIYSTGNKKLILLHCTSNYPTRYEDVNLKAMETLRREFKVSVGYSDHTLGVEVPMLAAVLGAVVVEKHFTLNKKMKGPDHKASLSSQELKEMIRALRNVKLIMGSDKKEPNNDELEIKKVVRKTLIAKVLIPINTIITKEMLAAKRSNGFLEPKDINKIIGKRVKRNIQMDESINLEDIKSD